MLKHLNVSLKNISNPDGDFFEPDREISEHVVENVCDELQEIFAVLDLPISDDEMNTAIAQLKAGKSGGEDLLINELFMNVRDILSPHICNPFNFIFKSGIFPEAWLRGC